MIQIAVKNYYSDPLEQIPLGKEIWGKTKSGGELWAWCGFLEWDFAINVMCEPIFGFIWMLRNLFYVSFFKLSKKMCFRRIF